MIGRIFVAVESLSCFLDGEPVMVFKGDTVREGHPLLVRFGGSFAPQRVKYEYKPPVKPPLRKK